MGQVPPLISGRSSSVIIHILDADEGDRRNRTYPRRVLVFFRGTVVGGLLLVLLWVADRSSRPIHVPYLFPFRKAIAGAV